MINEENVVQCSTCEDEYTHIIGTIHVKDNDNYQTTEVIINHEHSIKAKVDYRYRSQGNIHILLRCESGHFFIKSFDGHKGNVIVDDNPLMMSLTNYLNLVYKKDEEIELTLNYEMLGHIEKFLLLENR